MATVNIGNIKFTWQGAYNSSTAYAVDDIVSYNGSSYVCILASTGNLPTNTTYWNVMAQGGTDITSIASLAQGDILYYNGTDWVRLGAGTSGQVLQTGGTGANPSWTTVSSDFTKLAGVDLSNSTATYYNFTQFMDDSVYRSYKIQILQKFGSNNGSMRMRFLNNTTAYSGASDYRYAGYQAYRRTDQSGIAIDATADGDGRDYANLLPWNGNNGYLQYLELDIMGLPTGTSYQTGYQVSSWGRDQSGGVGDYIFANDLKGFLDNTGAVDGVQFYSSGGEQLDDSQFTIWGLKK